MVPRWVVAAGGLAWCLLLVGCTTEATRRPRPSSTAATPTRPPAMEGRPTSDELEDLAREWVAVLRVAAPEDLEGETAELLRLVPRNFAIAPIHCWVGLAERLGKKAEEGLYVSAVIAESRQELDRVVERVDRAPVLVGEFPAMCSD